MMKSKSLGHVDILIIGAGFYGCFTALTLKERNNNLNIIILEKEHDIMQKASRNNQSRIHAGYFFPKDISTACKFLLNAPKFIYDFREAIYGDFTNIYAVSKIESKINSSQFIKHQNDLNATFKKISLDSIGIFDKNFIEDAFVVDEKSFDSEILIDIIKHKIDKMGIKILFDCQADKVVKKHSNLVVSTVNGFTITSSQVYNCTYAQINSILRKSKLKILPLQYEYTEIVELEVPEILTNYAITVIDGPFFSLMPNPSKNNHTLSHVVYTKHFESDYENLPAKINLKTPLQSNYSYMLKDSIKFLPVLKESTYLNSIFEIKAKPFPINNLMIKTPLINAHELDGFYTILGGKMDSVYELRNIFSKLRWQA